MGQLILGLQTNGDRVLEQLIRVSPLCHLRQLLSWQCFCAAFMRQILIKLIIT